jgi:hypothetical protein
MSFDPYEFDRSMSPIEEQYPFGLYMSNTFLWMFLGLMVTFGVAILCWMTNIAIYTLYYGAQVVVLVAQLALVVVLSARVERMSVGAARGCFLAYSALTGLTLSVYLYLFDLSSLIFVFLATAVYFGAMGLYGHFSRSDLSSLRPILIGGLILLIVYGLITMFVVPMRGLDQVMSLVGIAVFLGFTAYDVKMIRRYYAYYCGYPEMLDKAAIFSALSLYLDFINLFLYLLRFMGRSKRN